MKDTRELRQSIIDCCLWMVEKGLVIGTWGNISVRLEDGNILITPSRINYHEMKPEDMVVLAPDGTRVDGFRLPTSERELHRGIMNRRSDVQAIIHTHSPYAMAAAALADGIPPISEEMCQLLGGGIPLSTRFVPSERHVELGEVVTDSLGAGNAVLIRNHGPVCCGRFAGRGKGLLPSRGEVGQDVPAHGRRASNQPRARRMGRSRPPLLFGSLRSNLSALFRRALRTLKDEGSPKRCKAARSTKERF